MNGPGRAGVLALSGYTAAVCGANLATSQIGIITLWPGIAAPAGVLLAGIGFTLRDLVHDAAGRSAALAAVGVGAILSAVLASPALALASGTAFAVSEVLDMAVYVPLHSRGHFLTAVAASNIVGLLADSVLFLWLAFGSLYLLEGQVIGKAAMTALAVAVLAGWHRWRGRAT